MLSPTFTLISVAKPWIVGSPSALISHSVRGFPGLQFSETILFGGAVHGLTPGLVAGAPRACAAGWAVMRRKPITTGVAVNETDRIVIFIRSSVRLVEILLS